jgi:hemoglobin
LATVFIVTTVYEASGGDAGLLALARAWHRRVMADEIVSHAFSRGFRSDHSERLAAYWCQALGGPDTYTMRYGDEAFVVREHSGNGPHDEMNDRAIACFDQALSDVGLSEENPVRQVLHDYFAWATPYVNRFERSAEDVPEDLQIPRWSWDGLIELAGS